MLAREVIDIPVLPASRGVLCFFRHQRPPLYISQSTMLLDCICGYVCLG